MERSLAVMGEMEERTPAETALVQAALEGERTALHQLLALHGRPLLILCQGMLGHRQDAEDAVQETFLRALRALPTFRGDAAFRTWIFRIAMNVCLNWRRARRPSETWDEAIVPPPTAPSPEAIALKQLRIREALGALTPRQRTIFLLKVLMGWSVAEIAAAVGWNRIRVQNELSQARRALAEWRRRDAGEGEDRCTAGV